MQEEMVALVADSRLAFCVSGDGGKSLSRKIDTRDWPTNKPLSHGEPFAMRLKLGPNGSLYGFSGDHIYRADAELKNMLTIGATKDIR
jgi:hypothetical protein